MNLKKCEKSTLRFLTEAPNVLESVNRDMKQLIAQKFEEMLEEERFDSSDLLQSRLKRKATGQIQQRHQKLRRFDFVDDSGDCEDCLAMFDDWDWSSDEFDSEERQAGGADREPLQCCTKLHLNFYDDLDARIDWNDFNFWRFEVSFPVLPSLEIDITTEERLAVEDPAAHDLLMECSECHPQPGDVSRQVLFSMKPPRYQTRTKYKWPQRQNTLLNESKTIAKNPKKSVKLFPKQP